MGSVANPSLWLFPKSMDTVKFIAMFLKHFLLPENGSKNLIFN